jgi:hypothetical protein
MARTVGRTDSGQPSRSEGARPVRIFRSKTASAGSASFRGDVPMGADGADPTGVEGPNVARDRGRGGGVRLGYSMWGFLGNGILDTPDGARAFRRHFVDGLRRAGCDVVFLQANRDVREAGDDLTREYAWAGGFPPLDGLLLEWRWPLPGRNTTVCGSSGHTCDLHRQDELVEHYTRRAQVPTLVWDLDRQLPADDPLRLLPHVVVGDFALRPDAGSRHLPCPVPDALLDAADPEVLAARAWSLPLVYVGNQYGRDDHFDRYFAPAAALVAHRVAGKWPRTEAWPHVTFTGRAHFQEVEQIHRAALATVLLLPERYRRVGHMTSRWWEALLAGCLPLLPSDVYGAGRYVPDDLQVSDGRDVADRVAWLASIAGSSHHADLIADCVARVEPFRSSTQVRSTLRIFEELR